MKRRKRGRQEKKKKKRGLSVMSTETPNNLHTKPKQSNKRGGGKERKERTRKL